MPGFDHCCRHCCYYRAEVCIVIRVVACLRRAMQPCGAHRLACLPGFARFLSIRSGAWFTAAAVFAGRDLSPPA